MRSWTFAVAGLVLVIAALSGQPQAAASHVEMAVVQEIDEEVPPGNPVIGDDRPGDTGPETNSDYALWGLVAVCLIGAGVLLVKVERWERRRVSGAGDSV